MIIGIDLRGVGREISNGVSVYTVNLIKALLLEDQTNEYRFFFNRQDIDIFRNIFQGPNVKFYSFNIPNKILNFFIRFFQWPKIDKMLGGVDVFWLPNLNFIALSGQCRLFTTIHDLSFKIMPEFYSLKMNLWHYFVKPKEILKKSKIIIAVSENTKNDLIEEFNLPRDKIEIIYPGLDQSFGKRVEPETIKKLKVKYNLSDKIILVVGTIEPRKNFESIISAFNKILASDEALAEDSWQLVLVGKRGWRERRILKKVEKSPYFKRIIFIHDLKKELLPAIYQSAKIFVWPSFYEGFGFPPLEALASGLPVITSFNSSLPEVLGDQVIYINPLNNQELAEAICKLMTARNIYPETDSKITGKFDWQESARQFIKILKEKYNENRN